jgi:hypothetical protein
MEERMVTRLAALAVVLLLVAGVVTSAPGFGPARAQEDDSSDGLATWPEIPTFQIPGTFATAGTVEPGWDVATLPGSIRVVASDDEQTALAPDVGIELILDNSGSMLQMLEGERRIDIAKEVLTDLVGETLTPGIPLALRVFGDVADSCETSLAIPLQPLDRGAAMGQIAAITSIDGVRTPLGDSLAQVASDLQGVSGPKLVVLVTDGEETCGGRPQRAIRDLVDQGIDVRVNIVGFAVDDPGLEEQFEEWARESSGAMLCASTRARMRSRCARNRQSRSRM